MKLTFAGHELRLSPDDEAGFRAELIRVEAMVAEEEDASLHVVCALERQGDHRVSMSLDLPKRFLFATESDRALDSAFRLAAETLIRKLSRYRERLERGRSRRRSRKLERSDEPLIQAVVRGDFEAFSANIAEHVKRLRSVISWELHHDERTTRHVRARISLDDLTDEVLEDVFSRFRDKPSTLSAEQWMIRRALEMLDSRIRESLREPREQQQALGNEDDLALSSAEYGDESERLRDLLPDLYGGGEPTPMDRLEAGDGASPDLAVEAAELETTVAEALGDLPRDWRRIFSLHFLEGFDPGEVAELLGTSEDQVLQDVEASLAFLRARLRAEDLPGRSS